MIAHTLSRIDPVPPKALEIGTVLRERYVIEQRLGQGSRGTVFRALDRYRSDLATSQQYVAIKVLHQLPDSPMESSEALRRELQCGQALADPNVVKVFDLDRDGNLDFLIMEFLEGELLSGVVARFRSQPMPRGHAWSIIRQIASGLQHAHERGIVHSDLRPQNIMILKNGEVRILDFGASHLANRIERSAARSASSGALAYASCELLDGRTPDPRDDLYALACISHELLTGSHPFQRRPANEARDLGVVPMRPSHFSRRQWRTLSKGLSWHRAGRSMQISDWLTALKPDLKNAPSLLDIQFPVPAATTTPRAHYFRTSIAATLLLTTGVVWLLFVRLAPGGKVSGQAMAPARASLPTPVANEGTPTTPSTKSSAPKLEGVAMSSDGLQVPAGAHFAEIRVHRPRAAGENPRFVWWTEAASAKPGIDYVSQSKVIQSFPAGRDATSVFVKLLPRTSVNQSGIFYIAVADRGEDNPQHVTHTAVRLASSRTTTIY